MVKEDKIIGKMTIERERIIVDICVVPLKLIKNKIKNSRWDKKDYR